MGDEGQRKFLSARPGRGATPAQPPAYPDGLVSIRAPRAGRDLTAAEARYLAEAFLSARPGRGATGR